MRATLSLAVVAAAVIVGTAGAATAQTAQVTMPAKLFAPRDLDVLVGTTVTWRNVDKTTHTVTEDEDEFDSGFVRPGGTFSETFAEQGTSSTTARSIGSCRGTVHVFRVVLAARGAAPGGKEARLEGVAPRAQPRSCSSGSRPVRVEVVARATPGLEGVFGFAVCAPEPRSYRVSAGSASSPVVRVRVTPRRGDRAARRAIVVSARPARAGSRVAIQVYDRERFQPSSPSRAGDSTRRLARRSATSRSRRRTCARSSAGSQGWSDGFSRPLVVLPR